MSEHGRSLLDHHRELLASSSISDDVVAERGYWSATKKVELEELGFTAKARRVPSLVIPVYGVSGELEWSAQRPDDPRVVDGKVRKYEVPHGARQVLDVPARIRPQLRDPKVPLLLTEGARKADAAVSHGLCCVSINGVYGFRGVDQETQGRVMLGDWEHIAYTHADHAGREIFICFDSDVMRRPEIQDAFDRLSGLLHRRGADVGFIVLPEGEHGAKIGLDDFFATDGSVEELWALSTKERPRWLRPKDRDPEAEPPPPPPALTLAQVEEKFKRRLYLPSVEPLRVLLGTIAGNRLPGEPVWTLLVAASGSGKSEFIRACNGLPEVAPVTTLSRAALLSGTSARDAAVDATGGVLRQIGAFGVLSFKDFTSTLSLESESLSMMLAALREIFDGYWTRDVGSDGGRQLFWEGKAGLIGGVTPAIDHHHAVIAEMGERLLLYRFPSLGEEHGERTIGQALDNDEVLEAMRQELQDAVSGLFVGLGELSARRLSGEEKKQLIKVTMLVARGRAHVYRTRSGELGVPERCSGASRCSRR